MGAAGSKAGMSRISIQAESLWEYQNAAGSHSAGMIVSSVEGWT